MSETGGAREGRGDGRGGGGGRAKKKKGLNIFFFFLDPPPSLACLPIVSLFTTFPHA